MLKVVCFIKIFIYKLIASLGLFCVKCRPTYKRSLVVNCKGHTMSYKLKVLVMVVVVTRMMMMMMMMMMMIMMTITCFSHQRPGIICGYLY